MIKSLFAILAHNRCKIIEVKKNMKNVDLESLKIGDKVIISDEYVGK